MRDANLTQDELAGMIGISRSQLTNALQSRNGLSAEPYAALLRFISNPPPIRQMSFSLK
jgi:transcriptional regulator with XRE-family HTH domain